jgi:hypothetical protein
MSTIEALQCKLQALRADETNEFQIMFDDARHLAAAVGVSSEEMNCVPRGTTTRSVYRPNAGHVDQDSTIRTIELISSSLYSMLFFRISNCDSGHTVRRLQG